MVGTAAKCSLSAPTVSSGEVAAACSTIENAMQTAMTDGMTTDDNRRASPAILGEKPKRGFAERLLNADIWLA